MTVAVVTPWHNHEELALGYMRALVLGPPPDEQIIVDNGSDPPLSFAAFRNRRNEGFHRACNQGLRRATTDVVVFLNNDVELVEAGWLEAITDACELGTLVGARLRNDPHGEVDGNQLPYLDGWCVAGMREELLGMGGFDERYAEPAYYGDNDLSLRARANGMVLREVPVGLMHTGSVTVDGLAWPEYAAAVAANRARFQAKARDILLTPGIVRDYA